MRDLLSQRFSNQRKEEACTLRKATKKKTKQKKESTEAENEGSLHLGGSYVQEHAHSLHDELDGGGWAFEGLN